jgi:hypothetical protein
MLIGSIIHSKTQQNTNGEGGIVLFLKGNNYFSETYCSMDDVFTHSSERGFAIISMVPGWKYTKPLVFA